MMRMMLRISVKMIAVLGEATRVVPLSGAMVFRPRAATTATASAPRGVARQAAGMEAAVTNSPLRRHL